MLYKNNKSFILEETIVALALSILFISSIFTGYIQVAQRTQYAVCLQAVNNHMLQRIEQIKATKWDSLSYPIIDNLIATNFPPQTFKLDVLETYDMSYYIKDNITIENVSGSPPLKILRLKCTWSFYKNKIFTNSIVIYRNPDQ